MKITVALFGKPKDKYFLEKIEEYKNSDDIHCLINDNEEDEMDFSLCVTKEDILKKLQSELDLSAAGTTVNYNVAHRSIKIENHRH